MSASTLQASAGHVAGMELDIPVEAIDVHPRQPRTSFDKNEIALLANSLHEVGLIHRLVVRPKGSANGEARYELLCGERRLRAARKAGWPTVPCVVRDVDDQTALSIVVRENLDRKDLNPIERAEALKSFCDPVEKGGGGLRRAEVGSMFGKSESWVHESIALLRLPKDWRRRVSDGELKESYAAMLCKYAGDHRIMAAIAADMEMTGYAWKTRERFRDSVKKIADKVNAARFRGAADEDDDEDLGDEIGDDVLDGDDSPEHDEADAGEPAAKPESNGRSPGSNRIAGRHAANGATNGSTNGATNGAANGAAHAGNNGRQIAGPIIAPELQQALAPFAADRNALLTIHDWAEFHLARLTRTAAAGK